MMQSPVQGDRNYRFRGNAYINLEEGYVPVLRISRFIRSQSGMAATERQTDLPYVHFCDIMAKAERSRTTSRVNDLIVLSV